MILPPVDRFPRASALGGRSGLQEVSPWKDDSINCVVPGPHRPCLPHIALTFNSGLLGASEIRDSNLMFPNRE